MIRRRSSVQHGEENATNTDAKKLFSSLCHATNKMHFVKHESSSAYVNEHMMQHESNVEYNLSRYRTTSNRTKPI